MRFLTLADIGKHTKAMLKKLHSSSEEQLSGSEIPIQVCK